MSARQFVIAAALAAVVAPATAQQMPPGAPQQPSTRGLIRKNKAPVSNDVLRVKLPKPQEADLANGAHLMVLEDHRLPRVAFQILIPGAGGYFDPADKIGLASYTAQVMREGTKTRSSEQLSQALETMAAAVNVSAGITGLTATLTGGSLTEDFDRTFEIASDVLLNPAFAPAEWERLKTRAKAGLQQQRSQPGFLASERFNRVIFGDHPAGRISATAETLDAITPEAMAEFHRTHYVPDHALIAIAGDISLGEARAKAERGLADWKKAGTPKPSVTEPPAAGAPRVYLVARPASVQTSLLVGAPSMTRTDPDYEELTVANRVLGGVMGRLFRHLREDKGYTYGIGSGFSAGEHRGSWSASTSVRTDVTEAALTDLLAEIDEMRNTPVPEAELADAKRAIVASFALSLENPQAVLNYYVQGWMYGLPADYWDTYPARISGVSAADAQAAARKYWDAGRLQIVAVGDATKITDILKKKGELEVYDADGRPVKAGSHE